MNHYDHNSQWTKLMVLKSPQYSTNKSRYASSTHLMAKGEKIGQTTLYKLMPSKLFLSYIQTSTRNLYCKRHVLHSNRFLLVLKEVYTLVHHIPILSPPLQRKTGCRTVQNAPQSLCWSGQITVQHEPFLLKCFPSVFL